MPIELEESGRGLPQKIIISNIDRKLYSCQRPLVSIRSTPENMTVLNGKQKVLLGGKQLKDNA